MRYPRVKEDILLNFKGTNGIISIINVKMFL